MSLNCRLTSLMISISAVILYTTYLRVDSSYRETRIQSKLDDVERKIRVLSAEKEANARRLRVLSWRWAVVRNDREILSRKLNRATKELNQLKCAQENVTSTGAWCQWPFEHKHLLDTGLASFLVKLLEGKSVASFGDGPGHYRRYLLESGSVKSYDAYDGSPWIENATNNEVKYLDLTLPQFGLPIYDWVLSIEVAEHIPREFEEVYLSNLIRHAKIGFVLSWAVPRQTGFAHVNARPKTYVEEKLKLLCFEKNVALSNQIRRAADLIWLRNNLNVFERRENCSLSVEDA